MRIVRGKPNIAAVAIGCPILCTLTISNVIGDLDAFKRVSEDGTSDTADLDGFKRASGEGTPGTNELDTFRRLSDNGNFDLVCGRITVEER